MTTLYDDDFYGWSQEQANLLRTKRFNELDTENLLEEIEAMGRSERRELESRLEKLLSHLLKWQYQPSRRGKSWLLTIKEQRRKFVDCLNENPSLRNKKEERLIIVYQYARLSAEKETNLSESVFPDQCPWTFDQIMDNGFFPE
ncbi:DUF29 family protein [Candidatus Hamiltonella defensa]|uniref:Uncharacterized protein n=1 Tax=Candidatus Williamhamiltonella defendens TaxID=138072 RepID=A0A4V0NNJ4_9ENTR|nr:DUF29 domain-containing protein [Candidatus Hamiltonella defensa]ASV34305.1 hypothetical protein CJJ18_00850 [Candidatus Hamiltonella defensa]AWK15876.1 hypothetical protein CCS40_00850 [Candidatus Hamiltonella defensa]AYB49842.1 hypothetical protein CJJ19_06165 [Candidatus Hamiltonella defensa]MBK4361046.1 DUF29 family protein [Candidatus Hamiltonella defensa]